MKSATTLLKIAAAFVLAAVIFAIANPRTVHAVVATLVQVTNSPSSAVPVQPIPARQATQAMCFVVLPDGQSDSTCPLSSDFSASPYTVPAAKRLVLDSTSVFCNAPPGQKFLFPRLSFTGAAGVGSLIGFRQALEGNDGNADYYTFAQNGIGYANPGSTVTFFITRNTTTGIANCGVWAQGHLEDIQ